MQDTWTARRAEEIQRYEDRNKWKHFFSAIKAVYGPPTKGTATHLSADSSTLLTEKVQILQRWAEHFRGALNRPSTISDAVIARLPRVETNFNLDIPPSHHETIGAVRQLSSGEAPPSDATPAEVYKHGGSQLMDHLTALFQEMWRQGEVSQDSKYATAVHLYKREGNRQLCDSLRSFSLLNIAGKIFAHILLDRLNNHLEQSLLPESHCGFRRHRGTIDMIFAAHQLQEKCQEMRAHLYSPFADLTKLSTRHVKRCLEQSRSPSQHKDEDVQGSHTADAAIWSGDLDGLQEAGAETQPLPLQLSSTDTEAEVAGPDPLH
ncbi:hypothetical protein SprV_0401600200 [Sparganum proliferum]